jgi:aspartate beta-hydroxylase
MRHRVLCRLVQPAAVAIQDPAAHPTVKSAMTNEQHQSTAAYREKARLGLRQGDRTLAEQSYERLLETDPDDLEALQQLASISLDRTEESRAIELLTRAHQAHPKDPFTLVQLGMVRMTGGDAQGAVDDFRRGLELKPDMFLARLRLGVLLDQLGATHEALVATFNALNTAQAKGRWLNDETTAPELRDVVKRATQFVLAGRRSFFNDVFEPLRQRYGASELLRVEQCLAIYLGEQIATFRLTAAAEVSVFPWGTEPAVLPARTLSLAGRAGGQHRHDPG